MTLDEEKKKLLGEFKNRWMPIKKHYGNPPKDCTEEIAAFINQTLDEYAQAVREEMEEKREEEIKKNRSYCGCPMCEHHSSAYAFNMPNEEEPEEIHNTGDEVTFGRDERDNI